MSQPQPSFMETVTRLDAGNDIAGLIECIHAQLNSPEAMVAAIPPLLDGMNLRPAYIIAMLLANAGGQNPLIGITLAIGGLIHGNPLEETRGLNMLRSRGNTLPLPPGEADSLYQRIVAPAVTRQLNSAIANSDHERTLRTLDILRAVSPAFNATCESRFMQRRAGATLQDFMVNHPHRYSDKFLHYLEIYERHFARYRNQSVSLIEFGVSHGGSLQMWKHYFGPQARIYGFDIDPRCTVANEENILVLTGDQGNRETLRAIRQSLPKFDIIVDDGGHTMAQQIATFEELFPHLNEEGVYLVEDLATNYWERYGGGYRNPGSFIEYSKNFIDRLNARYSEDQTLLAEDAFTRSVFSLHYYDSVLVIEKRPVGPSVRLTYGTPSFNNFA